MLRHAPLTIVLSLPFGCATPAFAGTEATLPDIGSSAARVITPEEQQETREPIFREMRLSGDAPDQPPAAGRQEA